MVVNEDAALRRRPPTARTKMRMASRPIAIAPVTAIPAINPISRPERPLRLDVVASSVGCATTSVVVRALAVLDVADIVTLDVRWSVVTVELDITEDVCSRAVLAGRTGDELGLWECGPEGEVKEVTIQKIYNPLQAF